MHVALLTPTLPWPADTGGKLRIYHLLGGLAQENQIDLFSVYYGAPPPIGPLAQHCAKVTLVRLAPRYTRRRQLGDLLRPFPRSVAYFYATGARQQLLARSATTYDLVICDELMMAPYARAVAQRAACPLLLIRPKIDSLHYTEMAQQRPWGRAKVLDWWEAQQLRRYELAALRHFDAALVCSDEDGAITQAQNSQIRVATIANGADTTFFTPQRQPDTRPTILLLGTMHYYPNVDSVHYFFETIYPALRQAQPDLQVLIVGHQPPPAIQALAELPGVTVTGSVDDVRPYMARSWLLAVPLRLGGGTRLKIAEAMAAGLPVVSTTVGAQGLNVTHDQDLLLADTPAAFVTTTLRLLNDDSLQRRLGEAGRKLVESSYSWQALGQQFATLCAEVGQATPP